MVKEWWGPQGVFTPVCEVDAKVGGLIHIVMEAGETLGDVKGTQWPMSGKFEEVKEPEKLVFSSTAVNNGKDSLDTVTTVTFDEDNGKTKMTVHVVATKIYDEEMSSYIMPGMQQGWNSQFDKLIAFVAKQK